MKIQCKIETQNNILKIIFDYFLCTDLLKIFSLPNIILWNVASLLNVGLMSELKKREKAFPGFEVGTGG